MSSFYVKARIKNRFLRSPIVVYDVIERYQSWYDLSYGNGGGDYKTFERKVCTFPSATLAETAVQLLSKYKGE